jgi:hypothetical protein
VPFLSKAQNRACFAQAGPSGVTPDGWDCREFAAHTNYKKLPERKRKRRALLKAAADIGLSPQPD